MTGWDKPLLSERLENAVRRVRPDIIITLNPDDTWAHPQHWGLARIVRALLDAGADVKLCKNADAILRDFVTNDQRDPIEVVDRMVELTEADATEEHNFVPPDLAAFVGG